MNGCHGHFCGRYMVVVCTREHSLWDCGCSSKSFDVPRRHHRATRGIQVGLTFGWNCFNTNTLKRFFSVFYFYNFLNVACKIKKKLNEIATPFQRHYLQFCFLLSVNQKGLSKKMFKRIWQVVETIFFASKITFLLNLAKSSNFSFFSGFCWFK